MQDLRKEGTIEFTVSHPHGNWMYNDITYYLAKIERPDFGIILSVVKTSDRIIECVISGPLDKTFVLHGNLSNEVLAASAKAGFRQINTLHIAVIWKGDSVKLYLNAIPAMTIQPIPLETTTFSLRIGGVSFDEQQKIEPILAELATLFNTVYTFQEIGEPAAVISALENGVNINKFPLLTSRAGSWEGFFVGAKATYDFFKDHVMDIFATVGGNGRRILNAHTLQREAQADLARVNTNLAEEKLKQERLKTMDMGLDLAIKSANALASHAQEIDPTTKDALLTQYFVKPIQRINESILDNALTIEFTEDTPLN